MLWEIFVWPGITTLRQDRKKFPENSYRYSKSWFWSRGKPADRLIKRRSQGSTALHWRYQVCNRTELKACNPNNIWSGKFYKKITATQQFFYIISASYWKTQNYSLTFFRASPENNFSQPGPSSGDLIDRQMAEATTATFWLGTVLYTTPMSKYLPELRHFQREEVDLS